MLFLSTLFLVFAPLPLLVSAQRGISYVLVALIGNAALIAAFRGLEGAIFYLWVVAPMALLVPYLMGRRRLGIPATVSLVGAIELGLLASGLVIVAVATGKNPFLWIGAEVDRSLVLLEGAMGPSGMDREALKNEVLLQMPSGVALFLLLVILGNVLLWLRTLPASVRATTPGAETNLKTWKAPEWLIWALVGVGALALFGGDIGPRWLSTVGWNLLYVLMAVYGLQGLSIFAWILDVWKVRGFFRSILVVVTLVLLRPLLVAAGVLDLWFDFRSRIRQN